MAILSHLSIISGGLETLGGFYLQLEALHKLAGDRSNQVKIARENLTYVENRVANGTGTSLEVKLARQELELALGEAEGMALSMKRTLAGLKGFLGLASTQDVTPVFRDSQRQVLGSFDPATVSLEEAKGRSYDLKGLEIFRKVQAYYVCLARTSRVFHVLLHLPDALPLECYQRLGPLCRPRSPNPGVGWIQAHPERLPAKSRLKADWGRKNLKRK